MKATLYMQGQRDPVAAFDEVNVVKMNDNHNAFPYRVLYKAVQLNAGKTMLELHRDTRMTLQLDDGRDCGVLLQHSSIDMEGNAVGVLRVLDNFEVL